MTRPASEEYLVELERMLARTSEAIDKALDRLAPESEIGSLSGQDIGYVVGLLEGVNEMIRPPEPEPPEREDLPRKKFIDNFKV